jgi:putative ABC transport system permease protein
MSFVRPWLEAASNLRVHKARSALAALGIIFGVASVICMLSISEVARRDAIGRIERLGLRNVILDSVKPELVRNREEQKDDESWIAKYGLTNEDLELLRGTVLAGGPIPAVQPHRRSCPSRIMLLNVRAGATTSDINVVATTPTTPRSWITR